MDVRSANVADVDQLAALWYAAGVGAGEETDVAEMRQRLETDDGFFVVGERDGQIVASAMGCYDGHRGHVKRVAIEPGLQGAGLGQRIMAEVESRFAAAGISKLRLAVWDSNTTALRFWEAAGWEELSEIRYYGKDLEGNPDDGC